MNQLAYTPDTSDAALTAFIAAALQLNQQKRNELADEADKTDARADRLLNLYHRERELAGAQRAASVQGLVR